MKITEELWVSAYMKADLEKSMFDRLIKTVEIICKKEVDFIIIIPDREFCELGEKDYKKFSNYLYGDLSKKYELKKSPQKFINCKIGKLGYVSIPQSKYLFGDDFILALGPLGKEEVKINYIIFTIDCIDKVHDLLLDVVNYIKNIIKERELYESEGKMEIKYSVATLSGITGGINCINRLVNTEEIVLDEFNEDLPNEFINKFIKENKSGICIFHGQPGCGKTSYIKYLMSKNPDNYFVYCGLDILENSGAFRSFVVENSEKRLVIISEDCEKLIKSRESGYVSNAISEILNMSSGLIGDLAKVKFIFTFNTNLKEIDSALLREGRLACEYEFKPLQGEKLINLANKLGKEVSEEEIRKGLTLAELFKNNIIKSKKNTKSLGFV